MKIKDWIEQRKQPGTLAEVAKRILDEDRAYIETEKTLRALCSLEAIIRSGGNQSAAARKIGLSLHTVQRDMRGLGADSKTLRRLARHVAE